MNPTLELFTLCDYATISQDQKLSVIGMFDQFFVANLPTNWSRMFLVGVLKGQPGQKLSLTLKLVPAGTPNPDFPEKNVEVTLGNNGRANLITELVNFPLQAPGVHKFEILSQGASLGTCEFNVTKTTATYESPDKKVVN